MRRPHSSDIDLRTTTALSTIVPSAPADHVADAKATTATGTDGGRRGGWSPDDRLVFEEERARITGYCRGYWYRLEQQGKVPRRIKLGGRKVAWLLSELIAWRVECVALRERDGRRSAASRCRRVRSPAAGG